MGIGRFGLLGAVMLVLASCAEVSTVGGDSSPEAVAAAAYRHPGPPAITLYTMINNRSGSGAHTSIMINGSQRVIFDPAGSVRLSAMPERGDVLYGVTPQVADFYERAHARETYHVRIQRIEVSAAVAEQALRLVMANGTVASARCAVTTSGILRQLPGFESLPQTWFPNQLADGFATLPGVKERRLYEEDADDKAVAIAAYQQQLAAGQ
ncbi:hypothetical protein [Thalassococcus lentus]